MAQPHIFYKFDQTCIALMPNQLSRKHLLSTNLDKWFYTVLQKLQLENIFECIFNTKIFKILRTDYPHLININFYINFKSYSKDQKLVKQKLQLFFIYIAIFCNCWFLWFISAKWQTKISCSEDHVLGFILT